MVCFKVILTFVTSSCFTCFMQRNYSPANLVLLETCRLVYHLRFFKTGLMLNRESRY